MFTGIIEEIGRIKDFTLKSGGARLVIAARQVLVDIKIGDSVAINGCCQTVVTFDKNTFSVDVSEETLKVTTFKDFVVGRSVNLERALTPNMRIGGHIVQGHVDCVGEFVKKIETGNFYELYFKIPEKDLRFVVYKGSIAVDGVSLTVADVDQNGFKTAIIPHTFNNTILSTLKLGDKVNIETDILGRYVEKFLSWNNNTSNITETLLRENGFI